MPVVAVLNPKGGSGKSTVAAHVATAWARDGHVVMLGDVDRQQSVKSWLRRRSDRETPILTWVVDQRQVFRPPTGVTHVVLDTPGALYGHDLARVVMWLDAVIVPVGASIFDRDASLAFLRQLLALPRVQSGRCRVCMVGMRWSSHDMAVVPRRLGDQPSGSLLCVIPQQRAYRECLEQGVTVFDASTRSEPYLLEPWLPLLEWLRNALPVVQTAAGVHQAPRMSNGLLRAFGAQGTGAVVAKDLQVPVASPAPEGQPYPGSGQPLAALAPAEPPPSAVADAAAPAADGPPQEPAPGQLPWWSRWLSARGGR